MQARVQAHARRAMRVPACPLLTGLETQTGVLLPGQKGCQEGEGEGEGESVAAAAAHSHQFLYAHSLCHALLSMPFPPSRLARLTAMPAGEPAGSPRLPSALLSSHAPSASWQRRGPCLAQKPQAVTPCLQRTAGKTPAGPLLCCSRLLLLLPLLLLPLLPPCPCHRPTDAAAY